MPFPDAGTLAVFVAAAVALLVVPGPAVLYIVAQSIEHGRTAGLVSMLGIQVGGLVHVAAAALGLSALLVQSSVAFNVVKFVGAAYLIFLGLRKLLTRERFETTGERPPRQLDRLFKQGIVVNILNPKTALFFFAFLPQFVSVEEGSVGLQIAVLGPPEVRRADGVSGAMAQVDKVTQQNASSAEESSAAAEELSAQAQELKGLVGRFHVDAQALPAGAAAQRRRLPGGRR